MPRRRASSPIRRTVLDDIPEASPPQAASTPARRVAAEDINDLPLSVRAIAPGPNAFALRAAEVDAHRLRSNAFYQQATAAEKLRRQAVFEQNMANLELTPPTAVHPALRENFRLGDTSPSSNLMVNQVVINKAKSSLTKSGQTPPLRLIPEEGFEGNPTDRSFIEGFHEELDPNESGNETGRTTVYKYTPKLHSSEFSKSVGHTTPQKKKGGVLNWVTSGEQPNSPKKGIFEKLGLTSSRTSQAPNPTLSLVNARGEHGGEALPPKAKAVLSTTPQTTTLGRSPSKKLGMFALKASDAVFASDTAKSRRSLGNEQHSTTTRKVNFSASVGSKTPTREQRPKSKRIAWQPQPQSRSDQHDEHNKLANEAEISGVFRAQSLQYFDRMNPPTPPAKNTPPHEKKLKAEQDEANRILEAHKERSETQAAILNKMSQRKPVTTPKREMQQIPESKFTSPLHNKIFEDDTLTRETFKLIGADGRTSPTKCGSYAQKHLPTIVKTPSVYSMHGSYHPDLEEEHSFEDVKKCADSLGLDGLRENPENYYKGDLNVVRSPSIYDDEWSTKGGVSNQVSSDTLHYTGMFKPSPSIPNMVEHVRQLPSPAAPASGAQPRQLLSKIPTPSKPSHLIKGRTSSRSSSKGSIPLVYPGLASDPSRMNLLEGLSIRRGSASGSRTSMSLHSRGDPFNTPPDLLASLLEKSTAGVQLSPATFSYSHPSARPSPLYDPSSPAFSPVVPSTPTRSGNNEALSASPSPPKTLTPSRNRGRIETYKKSTGSPIARDVDTFPVAIKTLQLPPRALTPVVSVPRSAASPTIFLNEPCNEDDGHGPLFEYPAEKPLIPLFLHAGPLGAVVCDPQKIDNVKSSTIVHGASTLIPDMHILDYTSYNASHRQAAYDPDGFLSDPIKHYEESLRNAPSWYKEVMNYTTDGRQSTEKVPSDSTSKQGSADKAHSAVPTQEKHQSGASQDLADADEESETWRRLADQQQAQIAHLQAELQKVRTLKTQEEEIAELRNEVLALHNTKQQLRQEQQEQPRRRVPQPATTSAASSAHAIHDYLASEADVGLEGGAPNTLRATGLYAKMQQTRVANTYRESEMVLRRKFASSEARKAVPPPVVYENEGSIAQVLAAIGGLSARLEAIEKEKRGGE